MSALQRYPFPGFVLTGRPQFEFYRRAHSGLLDYRYGEEMALAGSDEIVLTGICPFTLKPTRYRSATTGGEKLQDGRIMPEWRFQQISEDNLPFGDRAVAHLAMIESGANFKDAMFCSASDALSRILPPMTGPVTRMALDALPDDAGRFSTILIVGQLEQQADIRVTLKALARLLKPGGKIYFHVNFHYFEDATEMHQGTRGVYWALGWDFLQLLSDAGFANAQAITFWAKELGYLGAFNFLFEAAKA